MLKTTQIKRKKHDKIVMIAKNKLNSIESKITEALINNEINHEDFKSKMYRNIVSLFKRQKKYRV